jgi:hypothetical protein
MLLVGCGNPVHHIKSAVGHKVSADHPAALALVLVDVSKSTGRQRQRYTSFFSTVDHALTGGTLLIGDQIDADPLSTTSLPVRIFLEKSSLLGKNPAVVKSANARARTKALTEFNKLLRRRPKGDSILDALNIADDVFAAYPGVKTRYLIIFSDMVENSTRYRFTNLNLHPESVAAFVARERRNGRLPDLRGVETYVAGAGATRGVETSAERVRAVRGFWLAYFRATGATLPAFHYGPELIRFP